MRELGRVYDHQLRTISGLVAELGAEASTIPVPACPEWSVHDVIAHVSGNCADIITGNVVGLATDGWTAAQVETRRDWELADILKEWEEAGSQVAVMVDDFPGWYGRQMIADVTAHEHDVRGALDRPGDRDSEAISIGNGFLVNVMLHAGLEANAVGPLEVKAGDQTWIVGSGGPANGDRDTWRNAVNSIDPLPVLSVPPTGSVSLEPFELFRAVPGRRSAAQIRAYEWTVDPEPYLDSFGYGPFVLRTTDLIE